MGPSSGTQLGSVGAELDDPRRKLACPTHTIDQQQERPLLALHAGLLSALGEVDFPILKTSLTVLSPCLRSYLPSKVFIDPIPLTYIHTAYYIAELVCIGI